MEPFRTVKYYYLRFTRLQGDPHVLARGVAIGIFVGVTPTIPFHTILALALAFLLRGSKIAALLFTVVASNPFTFFFQYYFSWRLGNWLTFNELSWAKVCSLLQLINAEARFQEILAAVFSLGRDTILVMLTGGIAMALPIALLGYLLSYQFFAVWHRRAGRKK